MSIGPCCDERGQQAIARQAGVPLAQIEQAQFCIYRMAEEQASYRRHGHVHHGDLQQ